MQNSGQIFCALLVILFEGMNSARPQWKWRPGLDPHIHTFHDNVLFAQDGLVDELCDAAGHWVSASHLHWGLWGLAQPCLGSGINFDYRLFAKERLRQYKLST